MRERVPFLLYRAAQDSHALANRMLCDVGLAARQVGILTLIIEIEPMTQKALGEILRIDRTTMVALIDDLEQKELVARQRHPQDRRAFLIHPTSRGTKAQKAAIDVLDRQQERFLSPLRPSQRRQLVELLKRLQRHDP
jgi:DNA-binding MarR family transcriptional regulator